jgi:hypothetical protein
MRKEGLFRIHISRTWASVVARARGSCLIGRVVRLWRGPAWQMQVLPNPGGDAEPSARERSRTCRNVLPAAARAAQDDETVEPPATARALEAVEADFGQVAAVLRRHPAKQAVLRDAGRHLRSRSSVDRIPSTAGRDSTSDSNRRQDQPENDGDGDSDDPLHDPLRGSSLRTMFGYYKGVCRLPSAARPASAARRRTVGLLEMPTHERPERHAGPPARSDSTDAALSCSGPMRNLHI